MSLSWETREEGRAQEPAPRRVGKDWGWSFLQHAAKSPRYNTCSYRWEILCQLQAGGSAWDKSCFVWGSHCACRSWKGLSVLGGKEPRCRKKWLMGKLESAVCACPRCADDRCMLSAAVAAAGREHCLCLGSAVWRVLRLLLLLLWRPRAKGLQEMRDLEKICILLPRRPSVHLPPVSMQGKDAMKLAIAAPT